MTPQPSTCRGCGRKVYFVKDENGKTQILDAVAPVYELTHDENHDPIAKRAVAYYVTHFATCTRASEFSKGSR